ncbi:MAG: flagellar basal-body rod protein FlgF [Burkholderiales bacterium]|nr:flagellar basal-body rod protein FlgF [Burkholderiales bacterium]
MDRMIYVAASGVRSTLQRQEVLANNLANANTPGYRAETVAFRVAPLVGEGLPTRAFVAESTPGADFTPGVITTTGRTLDVAVQGQGFFAVQGTDGTEGYTRNGGFTVNDQGQLVTHGGQPVLGDGGPISVPPGVQLSIAADGSISAAGPGSARTVSPVGRLKLVNPAPTEIARGTDGLFRMKDGSDAPVDARVRVASGAIEGSNVNAVEAMVGMITLARQFEMQMKLMQTADAASRKGAQLLGSAG